MEPSKILNVWVTKDDLYGELLTEQSNFKLSKMYDLEDMIISRCNLEAGVRP